MRTRDFVVMVDSFSVYWMGWDRYSTNPVWHLCCQSFRPLCWSWMNDMTVVPCCGLGGEIWGWDIVTSSSSCCQQELCKIASQNIFTDIFSMRSLIKQYDDCTYYIINNECNEPDIISTTGHGMFWFPEDIIKELRKFFLVWSMGVYRQQQIIYRLTSPR